MSDSMKPLPFSVLLHWIVNEYSQRKSIFGIDSTLFYTPAPNHRYAVPDLYGQAVATPIGPAAGPHTQLAQNILAAWLTGARFIELKTVQIMDELEIPRPCIDMQDEGYNVEWSQELKLDQSAAEYIKAWALIPILARLLGWDEGGTRTVFNMSVGYNLEGIQSAPMTRFMDRMENASGELAQIHSTLQKYFPEFADVSIPDRLSNNVTLSTMHGCPPDEIERIASFLLEERGLHTTIKLNPTLLGKEQVLDILNRQLEFKEISISDATFEHDLSYDRAIKMIHSLHGIANKQKLRFGIKLSNTLPNINQRKVLPGNEMYMSGRALYPITMNLFKRLLPDLPKGLHVSYSAGADALNITNILSTGVMPVTVASDLLKPGGYSRFSQYLETLDSDMEKLGAEDLTRLAQNSTDNLEIVAAEALVNPRYKKNYLPFGLPKDHAGLGFFDCIQAPCEDSCAVHQDVPDYAWLVARGEFDRALQVILSRNPLPGITGYVCTEMCRTTCTQNNYEEPVAIRSLKRMAVENGHITLPRNPKIDRKVAIIGSGPAGLSAACFLALNGIQTILFEAKDQTGGMLRMIPSFRLPDAIIEEDIKRITDMGVEIKLNHPISKTPEELLNEGFDAVYVGAGFQKDSPLEIPGVEGPGVYPALNLLESVRNHESVNLGRKVVVIGGGDTAMDAVRVAGRITGLPATILYRRTRHEMPASPEEVAGALAEGAVLEELISPLRVIRNSDGKVTGLECQHNRLGEPDASGRCRPVPIEGSEFTLAVDSIIVAIGQLPSLSFLKGSSITLCKNGSILVEEKSGNAGVPHVYAGGDVVEGPDSIIAAVADGRCAAESICAELGIQFQTLQTEIHTLSPAELLEVRQTRARRLLKQRTQEIPPAQRTGFDLIDHTLSPEEARLEGLRCLQCSQQCDKCVEVCPNRANQTYTITPVDVMLPRFVCWNNFLQPVGKERFSVSQIPQIIHIDDLCNGCGNCDTFCMHQGKPYLEKPRLFLQESDFLQEENNAFLISAAEEGWLLRRRENGRENRMTLTGDIARFEDNNLKLTMDTIFFKVSDLQLNTPFAGEYSLLPAAEMAVILKGLLNSMPFLPTFQKEKG